MNIFILRKSHFAGGLLKKRFLILTEGNTHPTPAKTAMGMLRYRSDEVVALLDSSHKGDKISDLLDISSSIPIVGSIKEALPLQPDVLLIGIAPAGGQLPSSWRPIILEAIQNGIAIISGLHIFIGDDTEFAKAARKKNISIIDLRRPPQNLTINQCRAKEQSCFRIHTVGTDCNCGKKVTALEVHLALRQMEKDSEFIATGQTGMLISGKGIALDHIISDFVSGAAERLVLENASHPYLVIEGQGAITHPLYSGVTLSMLHGFCPQALILCHQPDRKIMRGSKDTPVMPPQEIIPIYEMVTRPVFPAKVVGIALNLGAMSKTQAIHYIDKIEDDSELPATDVIKFGSFKLLKAVLNFESKWKNNNPEKIINKKGVIL